jgi:hypothetical protein
MAIDGTKIALSKLDVGRRQLNTAIMLWFADGDPVSIHSLAYAAYEIIHVVSRKNQRARTLLFDSDTVKEEYRGEFNILLKKHANFFKHANKDAEDVIEFPPVLSILFMLFSIRGIDSMGLRRLQGEAAFILWHTIHEPKFLTDQARKLYIEAVGIDRLNELRNLSKEEFLQACDHAMKLVGGDESTGLSG